MENFNDNRNSVKNSSADKIKGLKGKQCTYGGKGSMKKHKSQSCLFMPSNKYYGLGYGQQKNDEIIQSSKKLIKSYFYHTPKASGIAPKNNLSADFEQGHASLKRDAQEFGNISDIFQNKVDLHSTLREKNGECIEKENSAMVIEKILKSDAEYQAKKDFNNKNDYNVKSSNNFSAIYNKNIEVKIKGGQCYQKRMPYSLAQLFDPDYQHDIRNKSKLPKVNPNDCYVVRCLKEKFPFSRVYQADNLEIQK